MHHLHIGTREPERIPATLLTARLQQEDFTHGIVFILFQKP